MADDKVTLQIEVDSKDAQAAIELFGKESAKVLKKTEKSFESFGSSLASLGGGITALLGPLATLATVYKSVSEANEAEKATRALAISLASTGEYSKDAVSSMQAFAEELSNLTGVDDDVINSQLAVAKSFGITNDQAKNLVKAASNLSAVTGVDLDTAVKQLGGTFDGSIGKIGNLGGSFRALTKEQLENGAAIDLVNKQYEGAGAILGDTFEGQLNRVKNSFNDAFKAIGTEIINDPNLLNGLKVISDALKAFAPLAAAAAKGLLSLFKIFGTGLGVITSSITSVASNLASLFGKDDLAKNLDNLTQSSYNFIEALNKEETATDSVTESKDRFDKQMTKVSNSYDKNSKNAEKEAKQLDILKKSYEELSKALQTAGFNELQIAAKTAGDRFKTVEDAQKKGLISEQKVSDDRTAILAEYNKAYEKALKEQLEMDKKKADELSALQKKQAGDIQAVSEDPTKYFSEAGKTPGAGVAAGVGVVGKLLGGKQGANQLISGLVGQAADTFLPGIGVAVAGIASVFAGGKDSVKQLVRSFIESIPDIIQGIIEGIPAIIEVLVEVLSNPAFYKNLIMAIVNGVRYFVSSVLSSIGQLFSNLIPGFSGVVDDLGEKLAGFGAGISDAFKNIGNNVADGFKNIFSKIGEAFKPLTQAIDSLQSAFQPLIDAVAAAADAIKSATGRKGGKGLAREAGGAVSDYVKARIPSFLTGGVVYASGGFSPRGTDTVPAMLTPGEMVVPRDMVGQLGSFLDGGGKSDALLMAILNVVQQPVTVQSEVKVNQSAFADIILQLNRQNARLAV